MLKMFRKGNQKGFTLIELLIVVAIIGILAAIAIPQFAAYRQRAYDSSAQSDVRNLSTSEAAYFADWQAYGVTAAAAGAAGGAGAVLTGPSAPATHMLTATVQTVNRTLAIGVGNNVSVQASTDVGDASFLGFAKHDQGVTVFAVDGDTPGIFFDKVAAADSVGITMLASAIVSSTGDDLTGTASDLTTNPGTFIIK